jgi:hypothetical protein
MCDGQRVADDSNLYLEVFMRRILRRIMLTTVLVAVLVGVVVLVGRLGYPVGQSYTYKVPYAYKVFDLPLPPNRPVTENLIAERQKAIVLRFTSPQALNAALSDPKVAALPIVKAQKDPSKWLQNNIVADFPDRSTGGRSERSCDGRTACVPPVTICAF